MFPNACFMNRCCYLPSCVVLRSQGTGHQEEEMPDSQSGCLHCRSLRTQDGNFHSRVCVANSGRTTCMLQDTKVRGYQVTLKTCDGLGVLRKAQSVELELP